jgi:NADH-quinone oxidoreductase subunit H
MSFNIYDFSSFTQSIHEALASVMSPTWVFISELVLVGLVFLMFYAILGLLRVYL